MNTLVFTPIVGEVGVEACRYFDHITYISIKHSTSNTFIGNTKLYCLEEGELVILGQWPCVSIM